MSGKSSPSPLKRLQTFASDNPLYGWLVSVGIVLGVDAIALYLLPSLRKPGLIGLVICLAMGSPTMHLLRRFGKEERATRPINPRQEEAVGRVALGAALGSVASLSVAVFGQRIGLHPSENLKMGLMFGFSLLLIQALVFGVAAQHTKTGLWGFRIAAGWFGLLVATLIVVFIRMSR